MTRDRPTALVAGATGLVGGFVLRELLDRRDPDGLPAYRSVTVLSRRPLEEALPDRGVSDGQAGADVPEIREVVTDFSLLPDVREALAADHVFCALGTTIRKAGSRERFRRVDYDYPTTLGRLSLKTGARHFSLVSSVGADPGARGFSLRVKGETEEALRDLGLPSVTVMRPSVIGGPREESRPMETLAKWALALVPGRYRTVHARDIARCMVKLALEERPGIRVVESEEIRRIAAT